MIVLSSHLLDFRAFSE